VTITGVTATDGCADCASFNTTYTLFQTEPDDIDEGIPCRKGYNACFYVGDTGISTDCPGGLIFDFEATRTFLEITCIGDVVTVNFYICGELPQITSPVTIQYSNSTTTPFDCCSPFSGLTTSFTTGSLIGCDFAPSSATVNFSC